MEEGLDTLTNWFRASTYNRACAYLQRPAFPFSPCHPSVCCVRIAIISDIHSNLEALEAVFAAIDTRGADVVYCLGDLVGYGADAAACVDYVRARCHGVVLGNHDAAVAAGSGDAVSWLPKPAQKAIRHNRDQLSDEQIEYLAGLPPMLEAHGCTFVHASPQTPGSWLRLDSFLTARAQFQHFTTNVCFIGHSHIPGVMSERLGRTRIERGNRYLINVGSVGQPRDGDPRACLAFFDTGAFSYELLRMEYDVKRTTAKILAAGLPRSLAKRLKVGQ